METRIDKKPNVNELQALATHMAYEVFGCLSDDTSLDTASELIYDNLSKLISEPKALGLNQYQARIEEETDKTMKPYILEKQALAGMAIQVGMLNSVYMSKAESGKFNRSQAILELKKMLRYCAQYASSLGIGLEQVTKYDRRREEIARGREFGPDKEAGYLKPYGIKYRTQCDIKYKTQEVG